MRRKLFVTLCILCIVMLSGCNNKVNTHGSGRTTENPTKNLGGPFELNRSSQEDESSNTSISENVCDDETDVQ